jgi:hypothetical protein
MSGKKKMILVSAAAVGSFAVTMSVAMFVIKAPPAPLATDPNAVKARAVAKAELAAAGEEARVSPKEKQLDELIRQVQQRIAECKQKEESLSEREARVALTQEMLKKQTKDLENQLVRLLAQQTGLSQEQDKLEKSRVRIAQEEKVNLKHTASIYEKMDAASGGRILLGLCEGQQIEDAVRILHFMGERPAAKVLEEITDKALAARLTEMLKRVREEG